MRSRSWGETGKDRGGEGRASKPNIWRCRNRTKFERKSLHLGKGYTHIHGASASVLILLLLDCRTEEEDVVGGRVEVECGAAA